LSVAVLNTLSPLPQRKCYVISISQARQRCERFRFKLEHHASHGQHPLQNVARMTRLRAFPVAVITNR